MNKLTDLSDLYALAEKDAVKVDCFRLASCQSISIQDSGGDCYIGIDPMKLESEIDEKVKLAHELGHCETGSFYNRSSPFDIREKHEQTANRWAVKKLVPKSELVPLLKKGYERWELAEHFEVTEDFINLAIRMYFEYGIAV